MPKQTTLFSLRNRPFMARPIRSNPGCVITQEARGGNLLFVVRINGAIVGQSPFYASALTIAVVQSRIANGSPVIETKPTTLDISPL